MLQDEVIKKAHVVAPEGKSGFTVMAGLTEQAALDLTKEVEMVGAPDRPKSLIVPASYCRLFGRLGVW